MGTGDAAPDRAELGAADLLLRLVDEAHTLAQVELHSILVVHILDLEDRRVLVLVPQAPLETHHDALSVQPRGLDLLAAGNLRRHGELFGVKRACSSEMLGTI